jgi:hypothetical protein
MEAVAAWRATAAWISETEEVMMASRAGELQAMMI